MDDHLISEDELDARLAERNPVAFATLESEAASRVLSEVRAQVVARAQPVASGRPRRLSARRFGHWRLVAVGLAVAVVAVIAFIGSAGLDDSGTGNRAQSWPLTVSPAQAATLNRIAYAAAAQSGPAKGQWLFQRYVISEGGGDGYVNTTVNFHDSYREQQWTNPGGISRMRDVYTGFGFDTPRDRSNYYGPHHAQLVSAMGDGPAPGRRLTDNADPSAGSNPDDPQNMPDTTDAILHRFKQNFRNQLRQIPRKERASYRSQFSYNLFNELALILSNSTSESQRAASLKAIAYVKGVKILGTRRDALGRKGLAMRYVWAHGSGARFTLIIDPKTGNLLQQVSVPLRSLHGTPAADFYQRTIYLQRAIVASMTSLPGGGTQPYHGSSPRISGRGK